VVAAYGDGPLIAATRAAGARYVPLRHVHRAVHPVHDVLGLLELVALIRRERPAIVHANSSKAGVLGRIAGAITRTPVIVFTVHGWAFKAYSGVASALYRCADWLVARVTTVTVCVTESERARGLAAGTCRAARTVVIANAIDTSSVPRAPLDGDPPRIVAVGRLAWPKDPLTLVRALARLRDRPFRALIVGEGPARAAVESEIGRLGLDAFVALTGDRDDVPELLATSDVFVLSSRSEGGPISVLEAMAAGLPVVASDVGGVREQVDEGVSGLLVPAGDPAALAAALERVLGDPQLRRDLGAAGRGLVRERFDLARQQRLHLELYARELARRGVPAVMP
jgi:glycosyltransferase involved in cell wall biosynthesis